MNYASVPWTRRELAVLATSLGIYGAILIIILFILMGGWA